MLAQFHIRVAVPSVSQRKPTRTRAVTGRGRNALYYLASRPASRSRLSAADAAGVGAAPWRRTASTVRVGASLSSRVVTSACSGWSARWGRTAIPSPAATKPWAVWQSLISNRIFGSNPATAQAPRISRSYVEEIPPVIRGKSHRFAGQRAQAQASLAGEGVVGGHDQFELVLEQGHELEVLVFERGRLGGVVVDDRQVQLACSYQRDQLGRFALDQRELAIQRLPKSAATVTISIVQPNRFRISG